VIDNQKELSQTKKLIKIRNRFSFLLFDLTEPCLFLFHLIARLVGVDFFQWGFHFVSSSHTKPIRNKKKINSLRSLKDENKQQTETFTWRSWLELDENESIYGAINIHLKLRNWKTLISVIGCLEMENLKLCWSNFSKNSISSTAFEDFFISCCQCR
jgi:hypothetical protein